MQEITIRANEAGQRFDKFLGKYMDKAPKSFFYKMLRKKNITLNGKKAAGSEKLCEGDLVKLFLSDETIDSFSSRCILPSGSQRAASGSQRNTSGSLCPAILYEDSQVIFFDKPAGMLSQKAAADDFSLVEYLIEYLTESGQLAEDDLRAFRPSVCNRLDRNTSGIVAAGKTLAALQELSAMFRDRSMKKYYMTLVKGHVSEGRLIRGYLTKDPRTNRVAFSETELEGAAPIETEYRPLCTGERTTLLEVHLITGKTHQIRAHLASQGHPIAGDPKYGDPSFNGIFREKYGLRCQLLHAARICIPECEGALEPLSGKEITSPLPELFRKICQEEGVL